MTSVFLVGWDWTYFLYGCLGCFAKLFLEYQHRKQKKLLTKEIIEATISILIAGAFVYPLQVTNTWQALIFGATWDVIFTSAKKATTGKGGKKK